MFLSLYLRVLCVYLCCLSTIHTVYTAPFPNLHARKQMLTASVAIVESKQHNTRKKHAQNTLTLLNLLLDYIFGVELHIKSGFINVNSAISCSFQR